MAVQLADVLRRHGPSYIERYGASMLPSHLRAMRDLVRCRTPEMGGHAAECTCCGREHLLYHSCGNRACPRCGHDSTVAWIARQRKLLLPVRYFHVVFTLPAELGRLVRSHQQPLLSVLFQAAFESLAELCLDPHYLGGRIGALAVLHTWTRTLEWHPHIHLLVPGGGLAPDGRTFVQPPRRRKPYLVPVHALGELFRGRFMDLARQALPEVVFPYLSDDKSWVVFCKPAVQGADKVLDYLGRYVHRTALSGKAIVACDDETVTFRYRPSGQSRRRTMRLPAQEFLRRFLQHVPPKGLHRVRAFGLLHPAHRSTLQRLQLLLGAPAPSEQTAEAAAKDPGNRRSRLRCRGCGQATLRLVRRLSPEQCAAWEGRLEGGAVERARAPP
jgi:Putative transposase/Transposase zinc-binding domain